MKAAFVLGLAVAANAQVDNEFVGYNPSGADLVRNAGWGRSNPIGTRTPIDYNTQYLNKYGLKHDTADEELFGSLSGSDLVKYAKQSQSTTYRPVAHVVRDDEADDELFGSGRFVPDTTTKKSEKKTSYEPYVADPNIRHHSDLPHTGNNINWKTLGKYDKVTNHLDDELFGSGRFVPDTTTKKSEKKTSYEPYVPDPNIRHHSDLPYTGRIDPKTIGKYDKVTNHHDDEELFGGLSGADLVKYAKQSQNTISRPVAHVVRDDADDELFGSGRFVPDTTIKKSEKKTSYEPYVPDPNIRHHSDLPYTGNNINWKTIGKYDKVTNHLDDELVYLGQLIKETKTQKPEIRRKFRPVEVKFDN